MTKKTTEPASPNFEQFWDSYGLKRDKVAAKRSWLRLSMTDRRAAIAGIARYKDDCEARGIQRMYAQGYLNHRRWEDEEDSTPDLPCMGWSDMHKDKTTTKGNYFPPSQGGDGGGSGLPDTAIW